MMDPVWGSASDRAALVSELGLARAGNLALEEGCRVICGLHAGECMPNRAATENHGREKAVPRTTREESPCSGN